MLLVTTPIKETWPEGQKALVLGEQCVPYPANNPPGIADYEILENNWSDFSALKKDYEYSLGVYERVLSDLSVALNAQHGTSHSLRYWRILVGPWLLWFTQIFLDRWNGIHVAINSGKVLNTIVLSVDPEQMIPAEMDEFTRFMQDDLWNHHIYACILRRLSGIEMHLTPCPSYLMGDNGPIPRKSRFSMIRKGYSLMGRTFLADTDAVVLNTYLPRKTEILFQVLLGQFPHQAFRRAGDINREKVSERRFGLSCGGVDSFEAALRDMVPKQLPIAYVEGYQGLRRLSEQQGWPLRPRFIYTANNHYYDDVFKAYTAEKVDCGTRLFIGTHGSGPDYAFSAASEHELSISDFHVGPVTNSKYADKSILPYRHYRRFKRSKRHGLGLLVEYGRPLYSYAISSTLHPCEFLQYMDDQFGFYDALGEKVQAGFKVRLYPNDVWNVSQRWLEKYPFVALDSGEISFRTLVAEAPLVVSSYMASNYSDILASGVPLVAFWNPDFFQWHPSANDMFNELKRVGIYHTSPQSAAQHVSNIWDCVDDWWESRAVKEVRGVFFSKYANQPPRMHRIMAQAVTACTEAVVDGDWS